MGLLHIHQQNVNIAKALDDLEFGAGSQATALFDIENSPIKEKLSELRAIQEETLPNTADPELIASVTARMEALKLEVQREWDKVGPSVADAVAVLTNEKDIADSAKKAVDQKLKLLENTTADAVYYGGVVSTTRGALGTLTVKEPREYPKPDDTIKMLTYFVHKVIAANPALNLTQEVLAQPQYQWINTLINEVITEVSSRCGSPLIGTEREYADVIAGDTTGIERVRRLEANGVSVFRKPSTSFKIKK